MTEQRRTAFEARWTAPGTWHVRAPWGDWTKAPGVWTEDEAPAAVRSVYGHQATKNLRVVVVAESGHDTRLRG